MKVLVLSDINSAHTQKWAIAMANKGIVTGIFSLAPAAMDWFSKYGIIVNEMAFTNAKTAGNESNKLSYLKALPRIKRMVREFNPDVLHAHYATSYGLLGALCNFHPFIISAWGSDVMDFPDRSFLHKAILKYNFGKADCILATSNALMSAVKSLTDKRAHKIPFGIDTAHFKPLKVESLFLKEDLVIGTLKSLEAIYGVDILIKAFRIVSARNKDIPLKLLLVGDGNKAAEYKALVKDSGMENKVIFTGKVRYDKGVIYHNMIDIFVNVSRNESFGVSVLEASACEKPVIASSVGGLPEVVIDNETGILVEPENAEATAKAIEKLITDKELRVRMGQQGRLMVKHNFDLGKNMDALLLIYNQLVTK